MAVLVTNDFPPNHGGIQRCMSRIAQELLRRGEPVTVVAPATDGSSAYDSHADFRVMRYRNSNRMIGFVAMTARLLQARLASPRSYTLASMWFPGGLAACLIPRFLRGRLGILAHGTEIAPSRNGLRRRVMQYVFAQADVIIANSTFTRRLLNAAGVERAISVVYLGIDGNAILPQRATVPTILSVGRLVTRKGFDKVITAMPRILKDFPQARYEIVGSGPQAADLKKLADRLEVSDSVVFRGAITDEQVADAYSRAWIFALPVRAVGDDVEGFGLVYLEAALASLPAIGGINSGAEDAIVENQTGLLVDGTSDDAVAHAILTLLHAPDVGAEMGIRGQERALRDFTWTSTAANIARLMRAVPATANAGEAPAEYAAQAKD